MLWWFLYQKPLHQLLFEMWDRSVAFPHANDEMLALPYNIGDRDLWRNWVWPEKSTGTSKWHIKKIIIALLKLSTWWMMNDDGVRTLTVWSDIRWPYMIYSCPPTSGMRARFRMETLAKPPPCNGNQPSVLSSRVITCARTFTNESLIIDKIKKRKRRRKG